MPSISPRELVENHNTLVIDFGDNEIIEESEDASQLHNELAQQLKPASHVRMHSKSVHTEVLDTANFDNFQEASQKDLKVSQEITRKFLEEQSSIEIIPVQKVKMIETNEDGMRISIKNVEDIQSAYSLRDSMTGYKQDYSNYKDQDRILNKNEDHQESSKRTKESNILKRESELLNEVSKDETNKTDSKVESDHNAFQQKKREVIKYQEKLARYISNNIENMDIDSCMKVFECMYWNGSQEEDSPATYQKLFLLKNQKINFKEFARDRIPVCMLIIDLGTKAMLRVPAYVTHRGSQIVDDNIEIHDINEVIDKFIDQHTEVAYVNLYGPCESYEPGKGFRYTWQGRFINVRSPYSFTQDNLTKSIGLFCLECFSMLSGVYHKDELQCAYNNLNKLKFVSKIKDQIPQVTYLLDKKIIVEINRKKITTFFFMHMQRQINDEIKTRELLQNNNLMEVPFWLTPSYNWRWVINRGRKSNQHYNFNGSNMNYNEFTDNNTQQGYETNRVMSAHPNAVNFL